MDRFVDHHLRSNERPALVDTAVAVAIATVALAAFICVAELVPSAWRFPDNGADSASIADLRRCEIVADPANRLACYDEIAERPLPQPAKGANAPAAAFGQGRSQ